MSISEKIKNEIVPQFLYNGTFIYEEPFGCGHINSTFAVYFSRETKPPVRYILQAINTSIFKDPYGLMENIEGVTSHLRKKLIEQGKDPSRGTLTVIPTKSGSSLFFFFFGVYWRSYPADTLHEIIPNFHNTPSRYEDFKSAIKADKKGRAKNVQQEIEFYLERETDGKTVVDAINAGKLPLRVTHNDTKLNNIMMDNTTNEGICVIDLDTVMPGSVLYDFGDSIRFGASTAAEDEIDLTKVSMSLELFEAYTAGFLSEAGDSLTKEEIELIPFSAKLMTLECGLRFLTDYLNGDTYFKIQREHHNLDRTRTQMILVADMERKMDDMKQIVTKYI